MRTLLMIDAADGNEMRSKSIETFGAFTNGNATVLETGSHDYDGGAKEPPLQAE